MLVMAFFFGGELMNGLKHLRAGIGFAEISDASSGFGFGARLWIVMRSNENHGHLYSHGRKTSLENEAGHAAELHVEHEAIEFR